MTSRLSSTVMVGRADEQKRLAAALCDAVEGRPSIRLVIGEAGIGKTRLVAEHAAVARAHGALVLEGGGVDLSGALLVNADLREADLGGADLRDADLRDADLSGAHLAGALFLSQFQVNSADGDARTELPPRLTRPDHWSGPRSGRRRLALLPV